MVVRHLSFGVFSIRMETKEAERVQRAAILAGVNMSAFVQAAIGYFACYTEKRSGLKPETTAASQDNDYH